MKPEDIIPSLLKACPDFAPVWKAHVAYWANEQRGHYIDMSEFAHFLVKSVSAGKVKCLPEAFQVIETLLNQGNDEVKQLVSIGLLEDIQTISSNNQVSPDIFLKWLGPSSTLAWIEIAKMWEGKSSLMDSCEGLVLED